MIPGMPYWHVTSLNNIKHTCSEFHKSSFNTATHLENISMHTMRLTPPSGMVSIIHCWKGCVPLNVGIMVFAYWKMGLESFSRHHSTQPLQLQCHTCFSTNTTILNFSHLHEHPYAAIICGIAPQFPFTPLHWGSGATLHRIGFPV